MERFKNREKPNDSEGTELKCPECGAKFEDSSKLTNHILLSHKRFTCEVCQKSTFPSLLLMLRHKSQQHPSHGQSSKESVKESYQCGVCKKSLCSKDDVLKHFQAEHGAIADKLFSCEECSSVFLSKEHVRAHSKKEHKIASTLVPNSSAQRKFSAEFNCNLCSFKFQSRKSLKLHLTYLHKGKRVKCFECDTPFTDNSGLKGRKLCKICRRGTQFKCKEERCNREFYTEIGEFHDQGDAKWIVIRSHLRGHNGTPFGQINHCRPIGRSGVSRPQGVFGVF
jgi:uncharacterized C2H2 Zn-finger protein